MKAPSNAIARREPRLPHLPGVRLLTGRSRSRRHMPRVRHALHTRRARSGVEPKVTARSPARQLLGTSPLRGEPMRPSSASTSANASPMSSANAARPTRSSTHRRGSGTRNRSDSSPRRPPACPLARPLAGAPWLARTSVPAASPDPSSCRPDDGRSLSAFAEPPRSRRAQCMSEPACTCSPCLLPARSRAHELPFLRSSRGHAARATGCPNVRGIRLHESRTEFSVIAESHMPSSSLDPEYTPIDQVEQCPK